MTAVLQRRGSAKNGPVLSASALVQAINAKLHNALVPARDGEIHYLTLARVLREMERDTGVKVATMRQMLDATGAIVVARSEGQGKTYYQFPLVVGATQVREVKELTQSVRTLPSPHKNRIGELTVRDVIWIGQRLKKPIGELTMSDLIGFVNSLHGPNWLL